MRVTFKFAISCTRNDSICEESYEEEICTSEEVSEKSDCGFFNNFSFFNLCIVFSLAFLFFSTSFLLLTYFLLEYRNGFKWTNPNSNNSTETDQLYNTHAILSVFGHVIVSGIGIIIYTLSPCVKRKFTNLLHISLQIIAGCIILIGIKWSYEAKSEEHFEHFGTVHGITGIAACSLFAIQMVCGIFKSIFSIATCQEVSFLNSHSLSCHSVLGLSTYWAGIVAATTTLYYQEFNPYYYNNPNKMIRKKNVIFNIISSPVEKQKQEEEMEKKRTETNFKNTIAIFLIFCGLLVTYSVLTQPISDKG